MPPSGWARVTLWWRPEVAEPTSAFRIGERIRQLRRQRTPRMTQEALAHRAGGSVDLIRKLEQGVKQGMSFSSLDKIAAALDVEPAVLLADHDLLAATPAKPRSEPAGDRAEDMDAVDVARLAERSDIGAGTLDTIDRIVDRLCCDYSREPPAWLLPKVNDRIRRIARLLNGHARIDERRRLLEALGWLEVLRATLEFDMREHLAAEASRNVALRLGVQTEHPEIIAWTIELQAWWALESMRPGDAVSLARQGQAVAPRRSSAMVQLVMQEARAWAQRGDRREAKAALKRAAVTLAALPPPEHPEHHMVFDAGKLAFFSADCYALLGMPDEAEDYAVEVIRDAGASGRRGRLASVYVDLGLARAERGEIDGAAEAGREALSVLDTPPPGTLWRAAALHEKLRPYGDVAEVRDWRE